MGQSPEVSKRAIIEQWVSEHLLSRVPGTFHSDSTHSWRGIQRVKTDGKRMYKRNAANEEKMTTYS